MTESCKTSPVYPAVFSNITTHANGFIELLGSGVIYTNENKREFIIYFLNMDGEETYYPAILYSSDTIEN